MKIIFFLFRVLLLRIILLSCKILGLEFFTITILHIYVNVIKIINVQNSFDFHTTCLPNNNLTSRKRGIILKYLSVHRDVQFEIALRKSMLNRSIYSWHVRRRGWIESDEIHGRERDVSHCCVAPGIHTGRYLSSHDKSPVAVRASIVSPRLF